MMRRPFRAPEIHESVVLCSRVTTFFITFKIILSLILLFDKKFLCRGNLYAISQ